MSRTIKFRRLAGVTALLALLGVPVASLSAGIGTTVEHLMGRWAGQGTVTPATGPAEAFKCVVTIRANEAGSHLRQNLRCKGPNHKFDAAMDMKVDGDQITGRWEDKIYSIKGALKGSFTDYGFNVDLDSSFFQARLSVIAFGCEQAVKLVPAKADLIRELNASLRKC